MFGVFDWGAGSTRRRRSLWGGALVAAAAVGVAVIGGGGSSFAQAPEFCPPTFISGSSEFPTGEAVRTGNTTKVGEIVQFNPQLCRPTLSVSEVGGTVARITLPEAAPATAKAVRVKGPDLCTTNLARKLPEPGPSATGVKAPICDQAVLAFHVIPASGAAAKAVSDTCTLAAFAVKKSSPEARAQEIKVPVSVEVVKRLGQQNLLEQDELTLKISDGAAAGAPFVGAATKPPELKQCNAH